MVSEKLPEDVNKIIEYLAMMAAGYGGKLKWNEVLMARRWSHHPGRRRSASL
jgi:hypothetical protein